MAKDKKIKTESGTTNNEETEKFLRSLVGKINKEYDSPFAYIVGENSPSDVKEFLPTGIKVLDTIIANNIDGGIASARITELFSENSAGKTLLAMYVAKKVQESGGYIVWVDSETAFSNTLADLVGLKYKISDGFLYLAPKIIDETFSVFERTLIMLREKYPDKKVLLVWDSLAGSRPRAEMEGEYGDKTMGLAAREYSTGFGRIVDTLGKLNVTMLVTNQVRSNIGNTWEPVISYGGKALKFYASIRIVLTQAAKIKDKDNNIIGNIIRAKVVKNRFAPPFRECEFSMYYNRGVDEWESVIEILCKTPFLVKKGGWYNLQNDEKSYRKEEIIKMLKTDKSFYESAMEHFNKEMIIVNDIDGDERIETEDGDVLDSNGALLFNQKDKDKLEAKLSENRVVVEEV